MASARPHAERETCHALPTRGNEQLILGASLIKRRLRLEPCILCIGQALGDIGVLALPLRDGVGVPVVERRIGQLLFDQCQSL